MTRIMTTTTRMIMIMIMIMTTVPIKIMKMWKLFRNLEDDTGVNEASRGFLRGSWGCSVSHDSGVECIEKAKTKLDQEEYQ